MDGLMQVFPIMMYVLGSILLVVTIILVIKLIILKIQICNTLIYRILPVNVVLAKIIKK